MSDLTDNETAVRKGPAPGALRPPPADRNARAIRLRASGQALSNSRLAGPATWPGRKTVRGVRSARTPVGRPGGLTGPSRLRNVPEWSRLSAGRQVRSLARRSSSLSPPMTRQGSPTGSVSADRAARIADSPRRPRSQPTRQPLAGGALSWHPSPHRPRPGLGRRGGQHTPPSLLRRSRPRKARRLTARRARQPRPRRPPRWQPAARPRARVPPHQQRTELLGPLPRWPGLRRRRGTGRSAMLARRASPRTRRSWSCRVSRDTTRQTAS